MVGIRSLLLSIVGLGWACLCTGSLWADIHRPGGVDEEVAEISIDPWLDAPPQRGWVEARVEIRNHLPRDEVWTLEFTAREDWSQNRRMMYSHSFPVAAKSLGLFRVLLPVYPVTDPKGRAHPRLDVRVRGPGCVPVTEQFLTSSNRRSGGANWFVGLSPGLDTVAHHGDWNIQTLRSEIEKNRYPIILALAEWDWFPESEKALSGVDVFTMRQREWEELAGKRKIWERWIAAGGHLLLVGNAAASQSFGLGAIQFFEPTTENLSSLPTRFMRLDSVHRQVVSEDQFADGHWDLRDAYPDIRRPFGVLMTMVILIAGVLGPLNLGVAFRRQRPLQVLWVTPLLSAGISLLIGMVILFSDGLGGAGVRSQHVLLLPEEKLEIAWQEQVSRTGLLLSSRFSVPHGWSVRPVETGPRDQTRGVELTLSPGGDHRGDWFGNRRIQAQVLHRIRTSRSRMRIEWREGVPRATSTLEAPLSRILYRDAAGEIWTGTDIQPGRPALLRAAPPGGERAFFDDFRSRDPSLFPGEAHLKAKGWFYAEAFESDRMANTLESIDWEDAGIWFLGPVVEEGNE